MKRCFWIATIALMFTITLAQADTVLVATFINGNTDFFRSRVYLWNPNATAANITARVFSSPRSGPSALLGTADLGQIEAETSRTLRLEDILALIGVLLPYTDHAGNINIEFTVTADNVRGTAQVFNSSLTLAFGTYPLEIMPGSSVSPTQGPDPQPPAGTVLLALLSTSENVSSSGSFVTIQGQVKNISEVPLEDVRVVITWFTEDDAFVRFGDSSIELDPILSGETSLFSVFMEFDQTMTKFTVGFQEFFGGSILFEDRR